MMKNRNDDVVQDRIYKCLLVKGIWIAKIPLKV
jgi:hypothetical protein